MADEIPHFPIRGGCPEPEAIAAYADGRLSGAEKAEMEEHLASCGDCFTVFSETARSEAELGKAETATASAVVRPRFGRIGIALAAAAALVAAALPLALRVRARRRVRPDVAELVAAVGAQRPFEPRLTGGFGYGPMAPRYRSAKPLSESESWEVLAAAAKIRRKDEERSTPATLDALGAANLILGKYDDAVSNLEEATLEEPRNARYLTDLSAAYLVRAREKNRADDYPKALEAAEKATELDPTILEAWFNRALALDDLPLKTEAAKAWKDYLKRDSKSGWADEARRRLAEIETIPGHAEEWKKAKARMFAAAKAGDEKTIGEMMPDWCQETREWIERDLLPAWARREVEGDRSGAEAWLRVCAVVSGALAERSGDGMMREAVAAAETVAHSGDLEKLRRLCEAHLDDARAQSLYEADRIVESGSLFSRASQSIEAAGSSFFLWPDFYSGIADYYEGKMDAALSHMSSLEKAADAHGFGVLAAQCIWVRGTIAAYEDRFDEALRLHREALARFQRLGDLGHVADAESLVASDFGYLASPAESQRHWLRSLAGLSRITSDRRRHTVLEGLGVLLERQGYGRAALDCQDEALAKGGIWKNPTAEFDEHLYRAEALHYLGRRAAVRGELDIARSAIVRISDPLRRRQVEADFHGTSGELLADVRPEEAIPALDRALAVPESVGGRFRRSDLLYARGVAERRLGRTPSATDDLRRGIEDLETDRPLAGPRAVTFFDRSGALYDEMIDVQIHDLGNPAAALGYQERKLARSLLDAFGNGRGGASGPEEIRRIQGLLPPRVHVLYFGVKDRFLSRWQVDDRRIGYRETPMAGDRIAAAVGAFRRAILAGSTGAWQTTARSLGNLLLGGADLPADGSLVVVIPERSLDALPWAALTDPGTSEPLVARHPIAIAPSGTSFLRESERLAAIWRGGPGSILVIADPASDEGSTLPAARREASDVTAGYRRARILSGVEASEEAFAALAPTFDVLHFAGHSTSDDAEGRRSLVFASSRDPDRSAMSPARIGSLNLSRTAVAVLASCGSAQGPISASEGAMSISRAFLQAGVPSVMATLWEIPDEPSSAAFPILHRWIAEGIEPVEALRRTQIELLRSPNPDRRRPAVWASLGYYGGVRGEMRAALATKGRGVRWRDN